MGRPIHESAVHLNAFEIYYALGDSRSIVEVSRRCGVHESSVHNWSVAFGWQKRLAYREKLVAELTASKAIEDEAQSRANALKICRAAKVRFAESLTKGTAIIGAGDFANVVKLELLLRGQATDRSELILGPAFDRLIDLLAAVIEREVHDPALRARLAVGFKESVAGIVGHA